MKSAQEIRLEFAGLANSWLICALAERDAAAAKSALIALGETPFVGRKYSMESSARRRSYRAHDER